ncbi:MAG TPA: S9 family peptidase [Steroidobacteraceae bacterium]|jgi:oligopeptidase B|nr:S9 family peptidase [Steroidobacteraceae bacterium]
MVEPDFKPPVAPARPHVVTSPHGSRIDPYYWLRDDARTNPEVLGYLAAENEYRERCMAAVKPFENALYEEIVSRLKQDDATVPYRKQGYWYNIRFEPGKEHPIFVRRKGSLDAPEEVLLDVNALALGHDYYRIGALEVSPNCAWLAFCEDTVGRRQYTLRFKNLATGEILKAAIADVESDLAWANDNQTILYVEKDPETLLGLYVKKHVLGTDPRHDTLAFEQTDKSFYTGVTKSKSERFVFIHMESTVSSEWRYAHADDPALEFRTFLPHERDHEYQVEHVGDAFVIRTNWRARNFRVMQVPTGKEADRANWQDVVGHRDDTFIEDFDVFTGFLALAVRTGGLAKINIRPWSKDLRQSAAGFFIASDEAAYATSMSVNPELDTDLLRYAYTSLTTPTTVYDFNVRTGEKVLLKRDPVIGSFDPANYRTEFLFAPARDGAQIPVSLVYRAGLERNGSAPLLQYAYGAYGLSTDPSFSSARLSLIDRGFIYAIAHVRGGQEMGRPWYDDGRKLCKINSFTDFIDVTRHLVAELYAAKDKVFAMGGSAGGLVVGAVANLSPGDYRGIVAQVPFVDVVTTMLDDGIPLTTNEYDEWGDPSERMEYEYMLSYSPYDNVRTQLYPAMFITTGLWDSQVQYYEPAKWIAKLRALKADHNALFLHVDMEAGHGGKSGRFQRYREIAMEYAFVLDQAGIRR